MQNIWEFAQQSQHGILFRIYMLDGSSFLCENIKIILDKDNDSWVLLEGFQHHGSYNKDGGTDWFLYDHATLEHTFFKKQFIAAIKIINT